MCNLINTHTHTRIELTTSALLLEGVRGYLLDHSGDELQCNNRVAKFSPYLAYFNILQLSVSNWSQKKKKHCLTSSASIAFFMII